MHTCKNKLKKKIVRVYDLKTKKTTLLHTWTVSA